jgi:hypothetical protein
MRIRIAQQAPGVPNRSRKFDEIFRRIPAADIAVERNSPTRGG